MYIEKSLKEYGDLTSQKLPAPGGGSVLALVASLGNSLGQMAMAFSQDRQAYLDQALELRQDIDQSLKILAMYREKLMDLVDKDTQAFAGVLRAYDLEKGTQARAQALELGYRQALEVPLLCFRYSLESLRLEYFLVDQVEKNIISDLAIASILSYAAMEGSLYNIRANLAGIKDQAYKEAIIKETSQAIRQGKNYKGLIEAEVGKKLL